MCKKGGGLNKRGRDDERKRVKGVDLGEGGLRVSQGRVDWVGGYQVKPLELVSGRSSKGVGGRVSGGG